MKLTYLSAIVVSSLLTIGTATFAGTVQPAYANPCAAQVNPCAANPCAANPCAGATSGAATGAFEGVAHPTSGSARIVEENGKQYLEFDAEFRSDSGPDLLVLLHEEAVPQSYNSDQYVSLGFLQSTEGGQRYEIPEGVSVEDFQSAVIWCRQFNVTFGYATF
ncbi:MAG: DM13 domain-containing protein [Cyanobacteria bacterium P01_F01_bin.86]